MLGNRRRSWACWGREEISVQLLCRHYNIFPLLFHSHGNWLSYRYYPWSRFLDSGNSWQGFFFLTHRLEDHYPPLWRLGFSLLSLSRLRRKGGCLWFSLLLRKRNKIQVRRKMVTYLRNLTKISSYDLPRQLILVLEMFWSKDHASWF